MMSARTDRLVIMVPLSKDRRVDLSEWVQWMRAAGWTPATIRTKTSGMQTLCWHAEVTDATQLTNRHIQAWLSTAPKPNTRSSYFRVVQSWARWALANQVIDTDPIAGLATPRRPRGVPRPLDKATINRLLTEASPRVQAYVTLGAYAGLRVHEIAKIRGEDFNLESGTLRVLGKGGTDALLPVHPAILELARTMPPVDWWFPHNGSHVSGEWVSTCIRRALRAVGSTATAHQLRHSFGTAVLRSSHDLRVTQELLRHSSPASTAIYTQVADLDKVDAIRALGWSA
jgi:integrase/recombinase XerD